VKFLGFWILGLPYKMASNDLVSYEDKSIKSGFAFEVQNTYINLEISSTTAKYFGCILKVSDVF
jgi:hypothetical protein